MEMTGNTKGDGVALPDVLNNAKHPKMIWNARSWITQLSKSASILNNSGPYLFVSTCLILHAATHKKI
jgi:hypothetical protein